MNKNSDILILLVFINNIKNIMLPNIYNEIFQNFYNNNLYLI